MSGPYYPYIERTRWLTHWAGKGTTETVCGVSLEELWRCPGDGYAFQFPFCETCHAAQMAFIQSLREEAGKRAPHR